MGGGRLTPGPMNRIPHDSSIHKGCQLPLEVVGEVLTHSHIIRQRQTVNGASWRVTGTHRAKELLYLSAKTIVSSRNSVA